jgi:hypothetical protein
VTLLTLTLTLPPGSCAPFCFCGHIWDHREFLFYSHSAAPAALCSAADRHLKLANASNVGFYHLNCEHGTGEAICEFSHSKNLSVYGLKTEGRFVTLWIRDCDRVSIFGTGGCGCSANDTVYPQGFDASFPPTLYRVERTPNFQFSSLIDQHSMIALAKAPDIEDRPKDMFDESPCPPSITHMLYVAQSDAPPTQTLAFDRPSLYVFGKP